jgi:glycine/D-amino acid oxidase-like deaminating enzyme/nitrite reductase/ring-hydroxylating ferredoxin subunit
MVERDGTRNSLWQNTIQTFVPKSIFSTPDFDVIIAGGGITGITLALQLQLNGVKCAVLEAMNIGFGTTGGTTAHLNTYLDTSYARIINDFGLEKARLVADATRDALHTVKNNVVKYSIDCGYEEVPGFAFSQNDQQTKTLMELHHSCLDVGLDVEYTADIPIPIPFLKAMKIARQAKFHPLGYLYVLADMFEKSGGVIVEHCRVNSVETDSKDKERLRVHTTIGNFSGASMVYATHIPIGINLLHLRCPAYRSYAIAVTLENGNYPKGLIYDLFDPYHYYRTQNVNGKNYLIVGGEDHKTGEVKNTNGNMLRLESHVRSFFSVGQVAAQWSSQFYEPVDGLPYIGHLPGNPHNVYVATGFGGNGMTYSHVAANILTDTILKRENPYMDVFSPMRLKPVAGFSEFVKHNADVVKQFVGRWFGKEELQEFTSIAPGEGKVVNYQSHSLALYKDPQGKIHAVNPACTHMKCAVTWNAAEKSWDCPCHGARYSHTGEVLNGPTSKNLEQVEVRSMVKK